MNVGIYVCVILAALSSGSLSLPPQSVRAESTAHLTNSLHAPWPNQRRQVRSAPGPQSVLHHYHDPICPFSRHSHFHGPHHANNPHAYQGRLVRRQYLPRLTLPSMNWRIPHKKKN